mmetsp:Transcript_24930/g.68723  ORF Transcript_24930/g.68723 Transcript_24930/m.68723 type:complete len:376 (-) Transcript_24930:1519-2646(-)|eukprot:CAMPEP_0172358956 /NCGR_PEP_ID=MMETSP1060-20121228/3217_1 /TAXON_ID=37318 /ORGANISM="Pseudo-nitzschia pungens, Strain cf. cingulata" /LENGTH=375 /DNA_ID=CAMNT_0013080399 /DNA_START=205 /DNA_END=1332 /DNA_ORIENTATION=+
MTELRVPYRNTLEESIFALRQEESISSLTFKFEDDVYSRSQELQKTILANKTSGKVECLKIRNFCIDPKQHNQCFDFYLRCLEGPRNETKIFFYCGFFPLTLTESKRFADAIASNGDITALSLMGGKQGLFREEGTFECFFDAVLDKGAVKGLQLTLLSFNDIVKRGCKSKLATNTTLKELELNIIQPDITQRADEGIKELSKVLRINRGLERIDIGRGMMTNKGRRYLLESLRDNVTLLKLDTRKLPLLIDPFQIEEKEERDEGILLQSQIDRHLEWNRIYKRCNDNKGRAISLDIYPTLLETLANKPYALFLFLRENNPQIFDSFAERWHQPRRRRSMRILKKRRIAREMAVETAVVKTLSIEMLHPSRCDLL